MTSRRAPRSARRPPGRGARSRRSRRSEAGSPPRGPSGAGASSAPWRRPRSEAGSPPRGPSSRVPASEVPRRTPVRSRRPGRKSGPGTRRRSVARSRYDAAPAPGRSARRPAHRAAARVPKAGHPRSAADGWATRRPRKRGRRHRHAVPRRGSVWRMRPIGSGPWVGPPGIGANPIMSRRPGFVPRTGLLEPARALHPGFSRENAGEMSQRTGFRT